MLGMLVCMAHSKLWMVLPSSVLLHSKFNNYEIYLFCLTTALINSTDITHKKCATYAADLQILNLGKNGELDKLKFQPYFKAMENVVKLEGAGAHNQQHSKVSLYLSLILSLLFHLMDHFSLELG